MMMGSMKFERSGMPNTVPAPSNSRMMPMAKQRGGEAHAHSKTVHDARSTGFLLANISARPKMMQLTTMSGRNTPSDLLSSAGT